MARSEENGGPAAESKMLGFRASVEEYDSVQLVAHVKELSVAAYLRQRCNLPEVLDEADKIRKLARAS